jgi:hypothetical protein
MNKDKFIADIITSKVEPRDDARSL